ncbi:MAG: response regulator [Cyanobacteria bacterium P01_F01_bin.150]
MGEVLTGLVLIVDDMPTNIEVVSEALETAGLEVAIALSGEQALQQLQYSQPNLILLDVMMPGINGFEVCQRLKQLPTTQHIPVIFMTALADTDHRVKGLELGAVDYITKPFEEREILTRVKVHLQLSQLTHQLEHQVCDRTQALQQALTQLKASQVQLIQSEKMSALGNLVAGVAHEINNPLGFLNGSINNTKEYVQDLLDYIALYQHHHPDAAIPVQDKAVEIDLDFLSEDLPKLVGSMKNACDRIQDISTSLRTFSRADTEYKLKANLHEGLDSTLLILKYRLKANTYRPAIAIIQDYGEIPAIDCYPGQINQVFMNVLANAIDMFDEVAQQSSFAQLTETPQQITIQTAFTTNEVVISIKDNGKGMSEEVKAKVFDHLFTTKAIGEGTGLGLAIARQIVEEKHGGRLDVQSAPGHGTEFCIRLPIAV